MMHVAQAHAPLSEVSWSATLTSKSLWKLKRECLRLLRQISELPDDMRTRLLATRRYDREANSLIRHFSGVQPQTNRIVIFLIFPKGGLESSTLRAFDYFTEHGYSVLAVSNVALPETEQLTLLQHCWRYMERPNFGYDFGGYRDAVLWLSSRLQTLERLVIFNNSTWFPLPGSRDWLKDAEALDVDFVGAASNFGTPRADVDRFRQMTWNYRSDHRNFHYCSFALLMRPNVFRNDVFLDFWKHLKLTDKKKRIVRRGEIGLTQWVLDQGLSHAATLDISSLDAALAQLDDFQLKGLAGSLIIPEDEKIRALQSRLLADPDTSRVDLFKFILLTVSRQGSSYTLAPYSIPEVGFPFLKKSPLALSDESAEASFRLICTLRGREAVEIRQEALAIVAAKRPKIVQHLRAFCDEATET